MTWRDEPPTQRQLCHIAELNEFSPYPLPPFDGTTKGEASDYIDRWTKMAHENPWAIDHGYDF